MKLGKGMNELRASGGPDTPQRSRKNVPDLLRARPVRVTVKGEKISNQTTMGKSLERFDEVGTSKRVWAREYPPSLPFAQGAWR